MNAISKTLNLNLINSKRKITQKTILASQESNLLKSQHQWQNNKLKFNQKGNADPNSDNKVQRTSFTFHYLILLGKISTI